MRNEVAFAGYELAIEIYIYIYSFSRCFYPKRLTIEEYNKRYIIKRQTDTGSAFNTNCLEQILARQWGKVIYVYVYIYIFFFKSLYSSIHAIRHVLTVQINKILRYVMHMFVVTQFEYVTVELMYYFSVNFWG